MSTRGAELVAPRLRGLVGSVATATVFIAVSLFAGRSAASQAHLRFVVAGSVAIMLLGLGARSPRMLLAGAVVWLTALGLIRRLVTEVGGANHLDPLLLVGPLALGILVLVSVKAVGFPFRTWLSRAVLILTVLILLGSVNPLEGSLFGGIAGLLFVLVPIFGFWVGHNAGDRTIKVVFAFVAILGIGVACYGLVQTLAGFPSWDQHWIDQVTFASLNVGGVIRPFASFSSAQEFAEYVAVAIVIWIGAASRVRYLPLSAVALAVLIPALVLESSRSAVVLLIVALGAMLGAWRRLPLALAAGLGALLLVAVGFGLRSYGPTTFASSASGTLVSHEVSGLSDPLNSQTSTVGAHTSLVLNGVRSAFKNPIGLGIGTVTISNSTFGGVTASTEADPSNMAVALGLPGLLAYLAVLVLGIRVVYTTARTRQDPLSLIALGVVVVTMFQWLNGGLYSVAFLPWLILGWADRQQDEALQRSSPGRFGRGG